MYEAKRAGGDSVRTARSLAAEDTALAGAVA